MRLNCCQRRLYHSQYTESNLQQLKCTIRSVTDVQDQDASRVPVILRRNAATIAIRLATLNELVQQILRVHLSEMFNLYRRRVPLQEYPLFTLTAHTTPITVSVKIDNKQVLMELDTGAAASLVSEDTHKLHWPEHQLQLRLNC